MYGVTCSRKSVSKPFTGRDGSESIRESQSGAKPTMQCKISEHNILSLRATHGGSNRSAHSLRATHGGSNRSAHTGHMKLLLLAMVTLCVTAANIDPRLARRSSGDRETYPNYRLAGSATRAHRRRLAEVGTHRRRLVNLRTVLETAINQVERIVQKFNKQPGKERITELKQKTIVGTVQAAIKEWGFEKWNSLGEDKQDFLIETALNTLYIWAYGFDFIARCLRPVNLLREAGFKKLIGYKRPCTGGDSSSEDNSSEEQAEHNTKKQTKRKEPRRCAIPKAINYSKQELAAAERRKKRKQKMRKLKADLLRGPPKPRKKTNLKRKSRRAGSPAGTAEHGSEQSDGSMS